MISVEKEMRVRSLLSLGMSGRKIAIRVRVARQTVKSIRESSTMRPRKRPKRKQPFKKLGVPRRCGVCGGKVVIWPCLLCNPETGV